MAIVVIAFPGAHTTLGLFQSAALGASVYGLTAIALNVMRARDFALAALRGAQSRFHPISSPANAD